MVVLGLQGAQLCLGDHRVHAHEHLGFGDPLAFAHQDLAHDPLLGALHDLEVARGHELSLGHRHDVKATECGPEQGAGGKRNQGAQHPAGKRRRRLARDAQKRRREFVRIGRKPSLGVARGPCHRRALERSAKPHEPLGKPGERPKALGLGAETGRPDHLLRGRHTDARKRPPQPVPIREIAPERGIVRTPQMKLRERVRQRPGAKVWIRRARRVKGPHEPARIEDVDPRPAHRIGGRIVEARYRLGDDLQVEQARAALPAITSS